MTLQRAPRFVFAAAIALTAAAGQGVCAPAAAQEAVATPAPAPAAASSARYAVTITATPATDDALLQLLRDASNLTALIDQPPDALAGLERRVEADRARLDAVLRAEGYYAATLTADIVPAEVTQVTLHVVPGQRYVLGATRLEWDGAVDAGLSAAAQAAAAADGPARAATVTGAQDRLSAALRGDGRAFAEIERRVIVDHDRRIMETTFFVRPGPAARFGPTTITGETGVAEDLIIGRLPWREGDPYRPDLLDKGRKQIAALGVFDAAAAVPDLAADRAGGSVPVTLRLEPRLRRFIGASAIYSGDDGFGVRAWWGHRNIFGRAERLRIDLESARLGRGSVSAGGLQKTDFNLGFTLDAPDFLAPRQDLHVSLRAISENPPAYSRRAQTATVRLERRLTDALTARAGIEQETGLVENNTAEYRVALIGPVAGIIWDASDNPLNPTRGFRLAAEAAAWAPFAGQGSKSFASIGVEGRAYYDVSGDGDAVLAGRLGWAAAAAQSMDDVPPHRRLYAGGGASVRGFALQKAGPRDALGDPTGGLSRLDAGVEARIMVAESIGVVPFLDAALLSPQAFGGFSDGVHAGAGLGVRYHTDFGPLRADLAFPFARGAGDSIMQLYVSFGQAF